MLPQCTRHPENKAFYHDSLHKLDVCFQCVMDFINRTSGKKYDNPGRITFSASGFIDVGNYNSGRDFHNKYGLIINVSDTLSGYEDYWFPINEIGVWSYTPFFAIKRVLSKNHLKNPLIFCHAGIHRSLMMAYCWLISLGITLDDAALFLKCNHIKQDYDRDIEKGNIPNDLPEFYEIMNENPTWSLQGVLAKLGVPNLLNNTSLREKTKYQDYLDRNI